MLDLLNRAVGILATDTFEPIGTSSVFSSAQGEASNDELPRER
jgi:hypothetical protein